MLDLTKALAARGWSDRQAGAEILSEWRRRLRLERYPTAATIATRVAFLKAGKDTWWRNHPHALAALAHLLACKPEELLHSPHTASTAIEFAEFAELTPLLPGQEPCAVRVDGWLGSFVDEALHQGEHTWFVVPPGAGKSLAIRLLRQRWGASLATDTTRTLSEAIRHADDRLPFLAEIAYVEPATDQPALIEITRRRTNVCILAPFARQMIGREDDTRWRDYSWVMEAGWHERLIRWAQTRVPDPSRLDPEEILEWLRFVDPGEQAFATPGDLLPLLARTYRAGLPGQKEGLVGLARWWLTQQVEAHADPWLRRTGPAAVEQLVQARISRLDIPRAPLSIAEWSRLLPESLASGVRADEPQRQASPSKRRRKDRAAKGEAVSAAVRPIDAIHALADLGALRTSEGGGLDISPAWVRIGLERDIIGRAVTKGVTAAWSLWAVEATRKDAVDDALDVVAPADLVRQAQGALAGPDDDLATVAAIEALFAAIARRLLYTDWRPSPAMMPTLQHLGLRQLRLLERVPPGGATRPFLPLTRHHLPDSAGLRQVEWLAEAWAFSFEVEKPAEAADDPGWTLPGWARNLRLAAAPRELPWPKPDWSTSDPSIRALLLAARRALSLCRDDHVPDDIPWLLLPWVIIDGRPPGPLGDTSSKHMLGSAVATVVGELLAEEPDDVCARAVANTWPAILSWADGNAIHALIRLKENEGALFDAVSTYLPVAMFQESIGHVDLLDGPVHGTRMILSLPERLRRTALAVIARQVQATRRPAHGLGDVVQQMDRGDLDLLVEFVAEKYAVGSAAASRVWSLDPERAVAEAAAALDRGDKSASAWFWEAPSDRYAALLDLLGRHRGAKVSWANRWLMLALPFAGADAQRVFGMMGRK